MKFLDNSFKIKRLDTNDLIPFKELILVFNNVFGIINNELPSDLYLNKLLNKNDFIV